MDKYRVDKFYTCLRYMLAVMYDYMASRHWSLGIIHLFNDALHEEVLLQVPNGVRYHIVDCCLEELCKATQRSGGIPLTEATFIDVLEPFFALAQTGDGDDPLQQRVVEQILLKFLNEYSVYSESYVNRQIERGTKKKLQGGDLTFDQVHAGTISQFIFEIAADDAVTKDEYRKALYSVHKQYERRMREIGPEHDVDIEGDNDIQHDYESNDDNLDDTYLDDRRDDVDHNPIVQDNNSMDNIGRKQVSDVSPTVSSKKDGSTTDMGESAADKKSHLDNSSIKPTKLKKTNTKKKQGNHNTTVEEKPAPEVKEEVITISKADQKAARAAMNDKVETNSTSNKRRNEKIADPVLECAQKRVKFGDNNRARSYKASMDGLTKLVIKPILQKSPERSILLKTDNKNKVIAINHQTQQSTTTQRQQQPPRFQNNNKRNNHQTANNRNRSKGRKSSKDY
jgi:Nucleolar protein,Nop52